MILWVLWIVTSSYSVQMATYPTVETCAGIMQVLDRSLKKPPRAVMADVVCVPTMILPGMRSPTPPAAVRPGPSA